MKTTTKPQSLKSFIKKHSWYYCNPDLTEKNFHAPESIQTEGIEELVLEKYMNGDAILALLKEKGLRPAGVYEMMHWFNENKETIRSTSKCYAAFGQTWKDAGGGLRVPSVSAHSDGDFFFSLGYFELDWRGENVLLVYRDVPLDAQTIEPRPSGSLTLETRVAKLEEIIKYHNLNS